MWQIGISYVSDLGDVRSDSINVAGNVTDPSTYLVRERINYDYLCQPVEGDPSDENVWEEFCDGEDREDDPVHEPLDVVVLVSGLDGLDGAVGGIDEADAVAEQLSAVTEHQPEREKRHDACSVEIEKKIIWIIFWLIRILICSLKINETLNYSSIENTIFMCIIKN